MGQEPLENIGLVCKECAPKSDPKALNYELEWFVDKHVKVAFTAPNDRVEHLWVLIKAICNGRGDNGFEFTGVIDNDPVVFPAKCGDGVYINRSQIEQVYADGNIVKL